jgi:hypothetical protein
MRIGLLFERFDSCDVCRRHYSLFKFPKFAGQSRLGPAMDNLLDKLDSDTKSKLFKGNLANGRLVCKRLCEALSLISAVIIKVEISVHNESLRPIIPEKEKLEGLKIHQLKRMCNTQNTSLKGRKKDLIERLNIIRAQRRGLSEGRQLCPRDLLAISTTFPRGKIRVRLILRQSKREEVNLVLQMLSHVSNLTSIDFEGRSLDNICNGGLQALMDGFARTRTLTSLCFGETDFMASSNDYDLERLLRCFNCTLSIAHLDLRQTFIHDRKAALLVNVLKNTPLLTFLDLSHSCLLMQGAEYLGKGLKYVPLLTSILLGNGSARHLVQSLRDITSLTRLEVSCGFNDEDSLLLADNLLYHLSNLAVLRLRGNHFSACAAEPLFTIISSSRLRQLTSLDLGNYSGGSKHLRLGNTGATRLGSVLHCLPMLTAIDLANGEIGPSGARLLGHGFPNVLGLTALGMSDNPVANGTEALLLGAPGLQHLDFSSCRFTGPNVSVLCRALRRSLALTRINLCYAPLGASGALALASALTPAPLLTEMNLCRSSLGPDGALHLAAGLRSAPRLAVLKLAFTDLGADGVGHFAGALHALTALTELQIYGNDARDAGASALAEALLVAPALSLVGLGDSGIGDPGATRLAGAIRGGATGLTSLRLTSNEIGPPGMEALIAAQGGAPQLRNLDVRCGPPPPARARAYPRPCLCGGQGLRGSRGGGWGMGFGEGWGSMDLRGKQNRKDLPKVSWALPHLLMMGGARKPPRHAHASAAARWNRGPEPEARARLERESARLEEERRRCLRLIA